MHPRYHSCLVAQTLGLVVDAIELAPQIGAGAREGLVGHLGERLELALHQGAARLESLQALLEVGARVRRLRGEAVAQVAQLAIDGVELGARLDLEAAALLLELGLRLADALFRLVAEPAVLAAAGLALSPMGKSPRFDMVSSVCACRRASAVPPALPSSSRLCCGRSSRMRGVTPQRGVLVALNVRRRPRTRVWAAGTNGTPGAAPRPCS
jgi:hypothetical protein